MNRKTIVIIGVIIGLLASSFLYGQGSLEIRAASNSAIAGATAEVVQRVLTSLKK
jgi:hypothetical protein